MTGGQTLIARAGLGLVTAAAGLVALSVGRLRTIPSRTFDRIAKVSLAVSRFGLYGLVFLAAHIAARGDVVGYYFPEALRALHGAVPYRDLMTSYAPLHPYMDAAAILVWRSPLAIVLMAILFELLLLPLWLGFARGVFGEQQVRTATMLYIASPISLQFVAIDGQDNVLIAVLLAAAVACLYRNRILLSGVAAGAGVVLVKFLPLLFAPVFFLAVPRRMRWVVGFLAVVVLGYLPFALMHGQLLYPLLFQAQERTASNLPYVVEAALGLGAHPRVEDGLLEIVLLLIFGLAAYVLRGASRIARLRVVVFGPAALTLALLLLSKKSWPPYLMLVLFPLCLLMGTGAHRKLRAALFAVFSVIAVVVHSMWATVFQQALAPEVHQLLMLKNHKALLFYAMELILVGGYAWLLWEAVKQIVDARGVREDELPLAA